MSTPVEALKVAIEAARKVRQASADTAARIAEERAKANAADHAAAALGSGQFG